MLSHGMKKDIKLTMIFRVYDGSWYQTIRLQLLSISGKIIHQRPHNNWPFVCHHYPDIFFYLMYDNGQGMNDENVQDCVSEHSDTCGNSHNGVIINVRKLLSPSSTKCSTLIG